MTVAELITKLSSMPQDVEVFLSNDEELNGVHKCVMDPEVMAYDRKRREIGLSELTEELIQEGFTEDDLIKGEKVVVL